MDGLGFSGLSRMKRVVMLGLALLGMATLARAGTPQLPTIPATNFNITSYGAVSGTNDNTTAIQATINAASNAGGGTVEIPAGTYLSGPLTLASQINLQIDSGATLKMLPKANFTSTDHFILATGVSDVEISGSGTIDGQGSGWWPGGDPRPYMVYFNGNCHRVLIQDITLQNPPKMHIVFKGADDNITIQGITINTTASNAANTDGIDLIGTTCLVSNCTINAGDDNIAIGSSGGVSTDILITNCTFGVGHGVSIGSNISGGVSNVTVTSCSFNGTDYGIRMKASNTTSSVAQNLFYSNITMTNIVHGAIVIYSYYGSGGIYGTPTTVTPYGASTQAVGSILFPIWRNITISNVTATVASGGIAGIIWGRKEVPITNAVLSHVNISAPSTFDIYNAQGIQLTDSQITVPGTTNTLNLYNAQVTVTNSAVNTNLVTLGGLAMPPTNIVLAFFNAKAAITDTNMLGAGSITLGGSTLTFNQGAVSFSNNLSVVSASPAPSGASTLAFTSGSNTFSGALSGSGPLTLNLPANSLLTLQGDASGFTGTLAVTNSGTLQFNQGTNTWGDANAAFDDGSLGTINNRSTNNITIFLGALSGGSASTLRGSDQAGPGVDTHVIGTLNSNTTFAGTITNGTSGGTPHTVALTKIGNGTFTLSGTNSYGGGTTVSNGMLLVNNTAGSGTGTGSVTVVSSATLGGSGVIGGPVTVNGTLSPGNNGVGTLTINNNVVVTGGAALQYALGTNSDLTVVSGNLTLGGILNVTDAGGFTNTTYMLFSYGGALTYTSVSIGTAPAGYTYTISTNTAGQVNLVVTSLLTAFEQWQINYFGSTTNPLAAAGADPDGDGMSNTNEFLAGTNPTNSLSALRIISVVQQSNDVVITWTTAGGHTNAVQAAAGDGSGGYTTNFTDLSGLIAIPGSGDATTNYVDSGGATNAPARYYRVRVVP